MTSGFLGTGVSGLQAAQQQLNTTSHNIANVNTEGYSRQQAILQTREAADTGAVFIGQGVNVSQTRRIFDAILISSNRENISSYSEQEALYTRASRVDTLLSDPEVGISAMMQEFFGAVNDMNINPSLDGPRQVVLSSAELLSAQFNNFSRELNKEIDLVNQTINVIVTEINTLTQGIADLSSAILTASAANDTSPPNDLLDQRDTALNELAELVRITTITEENNGLERLNVMAGNGLPLVIGGVASTFAASTSSEDPTRQDFQLTTGSISTTVTSGISGGRLGGLIAYRDSLVNSSLNQIGIVALGLQSTFNDQHQLGVDLNGALGGQFFGDINSSTAVDNRVIENSTNTGTENLGANIVAVNDLVDSNYQVTFDGTNYNVTRESDLAALGPFAALPATIDGFELVSLSGAPAAGDRYLITPTRRGAEEFSVNITDITEIAAAAPVNGQASTTNIGSGEIRDIVILDTTTTATFGTASVLTPEITIQFDAAVANQYTIVPTNPASAALGPFVFTPGQDNTITITDIPAGTPDAYQIVLGGQPGLGDQFSFDYNSNGVGDNRNGLRLATLETTKTLNGGFSSYTDAFGALVSDIGSSTREARINAQVSEDLLAQSETSILEISGVNLDEEAANLIRFQQAYQASAQIISIAGTVFDTLIQSVR